MPRNYSWLLPALTPVFIVVALSVTYTISVLEGHVNPVFPYVSHTGTYVPESCFFGQFMDIAAFMYGVISYLRFKQVGEFINQKYVDTDSTSPNLGSKAEARCGLVLCLRHVGRLNKVSLVLGLSTAFALTAIGNFQVTAMFWVHTVANFVGFICSGVYAILQTVISHYLTDIPGGSRQTHLFRVIIILSGVAASIAFLVLNTVYQNKDEGRIMPGKWTPQDRGFPEYFGSALLEWFIIIINALFLLSFTREFKRMEIRTVVNLIHQSEIPFQERRELEKAQLSNISDIDTIAGPC